MGWEIKLTGALLSHDELPMASPEQYRLWSGPRSVTTDPILRRTPGTDRHEFALNVALALTRFGVRRFAKFPVAFSFSVLIRHIAPRSEPSGVARGAWSSIYRGVWHHFRWRAMQVLETHRLFRRASCVPSRRWAHLAQIGPRLSHR